MPSATIAPSVLPTPTATPTPTITPSPTPPPLGAVWTFVPVPIGQGEITDIAHGDAGYVAVGSRGCADDCPDSAAAWFSADGSTWSSVSIPDGDGMQLRTVATDGSTWYAAGDHYDQTGRITGSIWRSSDAHTWTLIKSFEVGICGEGCPGIGSLAARPGSALLTTPFGVIGTVSDGYLSLAGGVAWGTGGARKLVREVELFDQCNGAQVATDGRRVVVLAAVSSQDSCLTRAWSSADGRTGWVSTDQPVPIPWTEPSLLVFAGGTFVTAGRRAPNGVGIYASPDGIDWTEIRTGLSLGDCRLTGLAGTADELVIVPEGLCGTGIWISRG